MDRVAVILAAGGPRQNSHFFPSYDCCNPGLPHDLIIVHRNMSYVRERTNTCGRTILLNKIIDGQEVPHKAFGAYRFAYQTVATDYDYFIFLSDDVVLRRDCWLCDIVDTLALHEKIGFGGSQILNETTSYAALSHVRSPFWFAKAVCLAAAQWEFDSDHDGEMRIGKQLSEAGYIGVQVGNKMNLGYDVDEPDRLIQTMEKTMYPEKKLRDKFFPWEDPFVELLKSGQIEKCLIESPRKEIGIVNFLTAMQPFHGLIYAGGLELAQRHLEVDDYGYGTFCIRTKERHRVK